METSLLQVQNLTVQLSGKTVLDDVSFTIGQNQSLAITGLSGSGKSTLLKALAGKCFSRGKIVFADASPKIVSITQQHDFKNLSNTSNFYYQQRFNASDASDALMVSEALQQICKDDQKITAILTSLGIAHTLHSRLIQLSNGEHKKFQLAKALLQNPQWLFLDNPYVGLDVISRKSLSDNINRLIGEGIQVLLVTNVNDIPSAITMVGVLENGKLQTITERAAFQQQLAASVASAAPVAAVLVTEEMVPQVYEYPDFSVAIRMINTNVVYGDRVILDNINWEVKKGECWCVSGHNGSGKSTLLSLVNGDNPQAFANEIYLFDKKKGSGESIWDIKQKIGYVSPELHHYFEKTASCFEVVASGLFDTIGLFKQLSKKQENIVKHWMALLHITGFERMRLTQLSNGQQRLVLLARALVKNPPLLILDEPCQGLDKDVAEQFIALVNTICTNMKKTLIYVSHYQEELPSCITHTLKLEQGKIAA